MKKFLLTTLLVLVTVVAAFAQTELTADITLSNRGTSNFTSINIPESGDPVITLKFESMDKGATQSKYASESLRMYANNTFSITVAEEYNIKKIEFTATTNSYATAMAGAAFSEGSINADNKVATWTAPATPSKTISYKTGAQARIESIKVTYTKAEKQEVSVTNENVIVTYNPNSPKLDLSENLPAEILENATLTFTGADAYIESDGTIKASNADADQTVNVAWTETATYKANNHDFVFLIKKAQSGLVYSEKAVEVTVGEDIVLPILTNPYNLPITYTSLDEDVATVAADGTVTIKAPGTTTIEASFAAEEPLEKLFEKGAAEYDLKVNEEGKPATPTFSFEGDMVDGKYTVGSRLSIETATTGAQVWYSLDGAADKEYTAAIELNEAKTYKVTAYAKKGEKQSDPAETSFTIVKKVHTYAFGEVAEQMVGRDRYFTMPALVGAEGVEVKYEATGDGVVVKNPGSIKGIEDAYFIIGDGTAVVKATIAGDNTYDEFTKTLDVTIVPEVTKKENPNSLEFDFSNVTSMGFNENDFVTDNNNVTYLELDGKSTDETKAVVLSFSTNDSGTATRVLQSANSLVLYKTPSVSNSAKSGGSFVVKANGITKVEIKEKTGSSYNAKLTPSVGTVNAADASGVFTWLPTNGAVNSVEFFNKENKQARIEKITVYYTEVIEGGEAHVKSNMAFSAEEYDLEEGDLIPNVVLPDDFEGEVKYLVNGEPVAAGYRFPKEDVYEVLAYTEGDANYLPAVATTNILVNGYELENYLTIHYSTDEGMHYSHCKTVEGTEGRYEFKDIEVKGYDGVDGKYYGHVFFSFYQAPAQAAALAPRREAAAADWASFNAANVIYTPEEHLAMAGANTTLVRNRANTLGETMPAVLRVPATNDTQKALNFTVQLDKLGTSNVTVSEGTQTGVESMGVDADGEAEYYTLQGVRVAKPAAGIYLRRQGGTVSKVLVK